MCVYLRVMQNRCSLSRRDKKHSPEWTTHLSHKRLFFAQDNHRKPRTIPPFFAERTNGKLNFVKHSTPAIEPGGGALLTRNTRCPIKPLGDRKTAPRKFAGLPWSDFRGGFTSSVVKKFQRRNSNETVISSKHRF